MRILGIDPGFDRCGWAILEIDGQKEQALAFDTLTPGRKLEKMERFKLLWQQLDNIFLEYHPDSIALESLYFSRNVSTALPVSEVRGLIMALAFQHKIPLEEYKPSQIKLSVTGYGNADKHQVTLMVTKLLRLEKIPKIDDTGDALAVALTHAAYQRQAKIKHL
jgi:crossover junction endodeoxyribonuclease RuvC